VKHDALPSHAAVPDSRRTSIIRKSDLKPEPTAGPDTHPATPEELLSPRLPGTLEIGHFDVLETVGRGGFGVVVKAFDQKLRRVVAIKMMSAELATTSPARRRFVREARAAAAVHSDNVVHIYAVEENPVPYLVMEYISGGSLQGYLDRTGPLDVRETLRFGAQIARGLAAAHATGLIHRDIKPANILLESETLRAKLTDFGLARAADDASLTQSGVVLGTPMYMAPEQARGEPLDARADLYSLGSVLYVMASGRPPFRAANSLIVLQRVAQCAPRPIREIIPETPDWLCKVIDKLHAPKPADRFQSAAEVAAVLESYLAELEPDGTLRRPPVAPPRLPATRRVSRPLVACVLLCAMACSLATVGVFSGSATPIADADTPEVAQPVSLPPAVTQIQQNKQVQQTPQDKQPPQKTRDRFTNSFGIKFARIPASTSFLGGGGGVTGTRKIEIKNDFYLGVYEVTQAEWKRVMGPAKDYSQYSRGGDCAAAVADVSDDDLKRFPVDWISWNVAQEFICELNRRSEETGWVYRLPSADEWEYACRGGPGQSADALACDFYAGKLSTSLRADQANCKGAGVNRPQPVGSYPPNSLGLHDMQGNVFELLANTSGEDCSLIGGMWGDAADLARPTCRGSCHRDHRIAGSGFRLLREQVNPAR